MNYWLRSAICDICKVEVRTHHMARHRLSKGHIARASAAHALPSDWEFAKFLARVKFSDLSKPERIIYRRYKYKPRRRQP